mmetsp:Transcript_43798/g.115694  ORF Transcript_43798/g.115694 Transcript_43798/m.115694 type:complete len:331 (+) Transcript_43798:692-1684(+)
MPCVLGILNWFLLFLLGKNCLLLHASDRSVQAECGTFHAARLRMCLLLIQPRCLLELLVHSALESSKLLAPAKARLSSAHNATIHLTRLHPTTSFRRASWRGQESHREIPRTSELHRLKRKRERFHKLPQLLNHAAGHPPSKGEHVTRMQPHGRAILKQMRHEGSCWHDPFIHSAQHHSPGNAVPCAHCHEASSHWSEPLRKESLQLVLTEWHISQGHFPTYANELEKWFHAHTDSRDSSGCVTEALHEPVNLFCGRRRVPCRHTDRCGGQDGTLAAQGSTSLVKSLGCLTAGLDTVSKQVSLSLEHCRQLGRNGLCEVASQPCRRLRKA